MKKLIAAAVAAIALSTACSNVETAKVEAGTIASNGEAVAVIQTTQLGLTAIFHFVTITESSLDVVINKMLVSEAKMLGASKVQLVTVGAQPREGLMFRLMGGIVGMPVAAAVGIAVK